MRNGVTPCSGGGKGRREGLCLPALEYAPSRKEKNSALPVSIPAPFDRRPGREQPRSHRDRGDTTMRFMILVPANEQSEAGVLPDEKLFAAMGKFNEEMVKAGVMLTGEGLAPTSKG